MDEWPDGTSAEEMVEHLERSLDTVRVTLAAERAESMRLRGLLQEAESRIETLRQALNMRLDVWAEEPSRSRVMTWRYVINEKELVRMRYPHILVDELARRFRGDLWNLLNPMGDRSANG